MKEPEFIELLNLYLDHEITPADAARLEAEVQTDPSRRRIYQQYCRMQKACTLLTEDFAGETSEKRIVAFEPRRSGWGPGVFAVGSLVVAAACVVFVLINRSSDVATAAPNDHGRQVAAQPVAQTVATPGVAPSAKPAPSVDALASTAPAPARRSDLQPVFATVPLTLTNANANAEAWLAAVQQNADSSPLAWMKNVQFAPVQAAQINDQRLDARSQFQVPASRTYSSPRPLQSDVQTAAFQFQR